MKKQIDCIEILWEGPLTMDEVNKLNNPWDYGIYQIYGTHDIFGPDSLLYIGRARDNSFAERIPYHLDWIVWGSVPVRIFVGRLGGTEKIDDDSWNYMIDTAEKLLIYYTSPPYNSQNLQSYGDIKSTLVINYKARHRLPLVVTTLEKESLISTQRWKEFGKK
jgi:hypothetical protein